jgi:hypothetical protein
MNREMNETIDLLLGFIVEQRDAITNRMQEDAASIKKLREFWNKLQEIKTERIRREVSR